ncbi:MAG: glutamate--tRNA ligase [Candidatus Omnitrophica bacterium]|nr:glutamate--tRNA ligase [Candidatus Omnitrophota bacterium]
MTHSDIRVRFAPSPTGHLHIGGVRTALFNWFFARHQQGKFLLRIEDTDQTRSAQEYEEEIKDSLVWLGLDWDDEIIFQSDDLRKYQEAAEQLIKDKKATRVDPESQAVMFHIDPDEKITFHDLVHEEISFQGKDIGDIVIIKSDGFPTYNFACVVDDHASKITHVIRGDDHIANTPKQIALYSALGYKIPKYAHIPLILGTDGAPLSKRHGAVSLQSYIKEGYLREGLINYLSLLGWGAEGGHDFFTVAQLMKKFSLKRISKTNAIFDTMKLKAINAKHIKQLSREEYLRRVREYCEDQNIDLSADDPKQVDELFLLYRDRIKSFAELIERTRYYFDGVVFNQEARKAHLADKATIKNIKEVICDLESETALKDAASFEAVVRKAARNLSLQAADLIHPIRVALTGDAVSPGLFELMAVLGKARVLKSLIDVTKEL